MRLYFNYLCRATKWMIGALGVSAILCFILAFTTAPFWGIHSLGTSKAKWVKPDKIVLLGGGGMPSESNLMRLWYAIDAYKKNDGAKLVIAIPGDTAWTYSASCKMALYAEERGVRSEDILFECKGANTRTQALNVFEQFYSPSESILLVTSPEHLHRAYLTFKRVGFNNFGAIPAFEVALEGDLIYKEKESGCTKAFVPEVGESLQIRYQFWTHLVYQVVLLREYCAISYYWINDWI